jgi:hypothetical protein
MMHFRALNDKATSLLGGATCGSLMGGGFLLVAVAQSANRKWIKFASLISDQSLRRVRA